MRRSPSGGSPPAGCAKRKAPENPLPREPAFRRSLYSRLLFRVEVEPKRQLDDPGIVHHVGDLPEGRRSSQAQSRVAEVGVVEDVIRLGSERHGFPLLNHESLDQGHVYVEESRAPECIASCSAQGTGGGESEIRDLGRSEIVDARTNTVVGGHDAADVARTCVVAERSGGAGAGGAAGTAGQRRAALPDPLTAQVPSANQGVHPARHIAAQQLAFAYGELVESRGAEDMRNVEIGASAHQSRVEAVEWRGEPVALASRGRRLVVIDRLA